MKRAATVGCGVLLGLWGCSGSLQHGEPLTMSFVTPVPLATGRAITPAGTEGQNVGNLPMNVVVSADGRYAVTSDMGYWQAMWSIRTADAKGVSHLDFSNRRDRNGGTTRPARGAETANNGEAAQNQPAPRGAQTNGLYLGLVITKDNVIYAAQGAQDSIAVLHLGDDGTLQSKGSIPTKHQDFPAGLALDDRGYLYVANNASGNGDPFKLTGSMAIYNRDSGKELGRYTFSQSYGGTSNFPFAIAALRDGSKTYVASERDDAVYALNTKDPSNPQLIGKISTGARPVALTFSSSQDRLYVANSLSDTVAVIDPSSDQVVATGLLRPGIVRDLPGATPTAIAVSRDDQTLYVTLADMNAVAVVDAKSMEVQGYIPAGWYPTTLAIVGNGDQLLVVNGKGTRARVPNNAADPHDPRRKTGYSLSVYEGNLSKIQLPKGDDLKAATQQVLANDRLDVLATSGANPLADISLAAGKIKHVIYIVKENRTYDQVLGDLPQGNGDPSLVLFGRNVTPNLHALAERFVLMDNLYACGEVSGDGWVWSTQGMADAYVARNVPYQYSNRGRRYDFEGQNNGYVTGGFPADDENGKPMSKEPEFASGATRIPDVANTGRNLWDAAKEAGISIRNYGFFLSSTDRGQGMGGGPDNYPTAPGLQPPGHDLAGVTDVDFRRFDLDYPDSDASQTYFAKTQDADCLYVKKAYGAAKMPSRFSEWNREFQMMLARDPSGSGVPNLMLVRVGTDHTEGTRGGKHTPSAYVADNDYAMAEYIQALSHSPIWESCAVFVIEDDAQNGADHVDAHRTTGFVISPWIKAHSVDHQFHNTDSMLRTMELILGLKPLSQYDAIADPIMDWDKSPSNSQPYDAILPPQDLIAQMNPDQRDLRAGDPRLEMAKESEAMDFDHADAAPADELNKIIWASVKGVNSVMPPPREIDMSKFGVPQAKRDRDDDDD